MGGASIMFVVMVLMVGITIYLVGMLVRTIQLGKRTKMKLWKNFGLSLGFCTLFLLSWAGQAAVQWQEFTDEQGTHNVQPEVGDFLGAFGKSTLENWQSEFLQLFSFTVMTALLIHKGSAESRDSDDRIEAALKRIEDKLGTEPTLQGTEALRQGRDLHVIPDGFEGWPSRTRPRRNRRVTTTAKITPSTGHVIWPAGGGCSSSYTAKTARCARRRDRSERQVGCGCHGAEREGCRGGGDVSMGKDHGPSVKNDKQYEGLRKKGMSKQRAARIANDPKSSQKGGKKSSSGGRSTTSSRAGGTKAQKAAAGRKGGKKSS
jgi:hypothetical protein